jgi:hypothetical protein
MRFRLSWLLDPRGIVYEGACENRDVSVASEETRVPALSFPDPATPAFIGLDLFGVEGRDTFTLRRLEQCLSVCVHYRDGAAPACGDHEAAAARLIRVIRCNQGCCRRERVFENR